MALKDERIHLFPWFGHHGFALAPFGIFVGSEDKFLLMHEMGHVLQARQYGLLKFYVCYAIPSVFSFWFRRKEHWKFYAEIDANRLSAEYHKTRVSEMELKNFVALFPTEKPSILS